MVEKAEALAAAIEKSDLETARALFVPARAPYKRIEPVAYRFSDLENAIDPVADYLAEREEDKAFTGYHRIEYGLFAKNSLDGLAPIADRLVTDVTALAERLRHMELSPSILTESAGAMAEQLARGRIMAGEDHYAHTDLAEFEANLAGIGRMVDLLNPVLGPAAPEIDADVEETLETTRSVLDGMKSDEGFPSYEKVDEEARTELTRAFQDLARALNRVPDAIGLS